MISDSVDSFLFRWFRKIYKTNKWDGVCVWRCHGLSLSRSFSHSLSHLAHLRTRTHAHGHRHTHTGRCPPTINTWINFHSGSSLLSESVAAASACSWCSGKFIMFLKCASLSLLNQPFPHSLVANIGYLFCFLNKEDVVVWRRVVVVTTLFV